MSKPVEYPLYAVGTGQGIAVRDSKHRCVASLQIRDWVSQEERQEIRDQLLMMVAKYREEARSSVRPADSA